MTQSVGRKLVYTTLSSTKMFSAAFPFDIQYCGVYFGAGMADLDRVRLLPRRIFYDDVWVKKAQNKVSHTV